MNDITKPDTATFIQIIENLYDGVYFVDTNRMITYWNNAAEQISGYSAEEVVGSACSDNILTHVDGEGRSLCLGGCPLSATIADGKRRDAEVFLHHKEGHRVPIQVRTSILKNKEGLIIGGAEIFKDISNVQANTLRIIELEKLALLDNLTQLPNRNYIDRELSARLREFKRNKVTFGVFFIDLDYFKNINDTYGHAVGDEVLRLVARSFIASSRPFDLYGRWGGDEFVGIIRDVSSENLTVLGERLRHLIRHSYIMHNLSKLSVTISLGATLVHENDTFDSLLKRADTLLYSSKNQGRDHITIG